MKQQTDAGTPTVFRARETGARVTADGDRWSCTGCGKSGQEKDVAAFARDHARFCAVLPLA
ncbi:hypothetical protein ACIQWB_37740 [Streptomyces olivaceus]|uniref:hypothetical protein n=1 Tax=Streptomyces olivaceus TaxID=47716 RepID=UPI003828B253